jgi:hypothetical protein
MWVIAGLFLLWLLFIIMIAVMERGLRKPDDPDD